MNNRIPNRAGNLERLDVYVSGSRYFKDKIIIQKYLYKNS